MVDYVDIVVWKSTTHTFVYEILASCPQMSANPNK